MATKAEGVHPFSFRTRKLSPPAICKVLDTIWEPHDVADHIKKYNINKSKYRRYFISIMLEDINAFLCTGNSGDFITKFDKVDIIIEKGNL